MDAKLSEIVLQWGRSHPAAEMPQECLRAALEERFNGAAAIRLRKCGCPDERNRTIGSSMGRSHPAAEMVVFGSTIQAIPHPFHGAAAIRLRKYSDIGKHRVGGAASMGPQPSGCGNAWRERTLKGSYFASMGPQPSGCGNDRRGDDHNDRLLASMGPQPSGCGNASDVWLVGATVHASMGPQPSGCGNGALAAGESAIGKLQWGRSHPAAEITAGDQL